MRNLPALLMPGGLILLAALAALRPDVLPDSMRPYLHAYPYVVGGLGVFLGWFFNRSRVVFGLAILALADVALRHFGMGQGEAGAVGRTAFDLVGALLPLNLAAYATLSERGTLTARGLKRLVPLLAQALLVSLIAPRDWRGVAVWLEHRIVDASFTAWTPVAQPALLAFSAAIGFQTVRCVLRQSTIEAGFLWAEVAAFLALHGSRFGWVPTHFLATGGLAFVWAALHTSYRMAYHDDLTGLPGRRALNEALLQLDGRYAVAMLDVDHFKRFNDTYGHDVGDQVLRMVASKLDRVTGGGRGFRYGGEEFCVIFPGRSAEAAATHLEALRIAVAGSRFVLRGPDRPRKKPAAPKESRPQRQGVSVTVSIGLADWNGQKAEAYQVLKAADQALYRAKKAGRNRLVVG